MIYDLNRNAVTRWADFENPSAEKEKAALLNGGAKGHAFDQVKPGQTVTLMAAKGSGIIHRIWMTISNRSPYMLRALVLRMYWDDSGKPAVECPLGDFFCFSTGRMVAYESELTSSPEGRSFNSFIPMPFRKAAKITITNESEVPITRLFYDVDFTLEPIESEDTMYFHAWWNRENPTRLLEDYTALPKFAGPGRFLGMAVGVRTAEQYEDTWFGEGEVKMYIDGDETNPTIAGTGIEDYIGTAWGQGCYSNRTQGCLEAEPKGGRWSFYRWHTVDPVWFTQDISVRIQQIGGAGPDVIRRFMKSGVNMHIVTSDNDASFERLFDRDHPFRLDDSMHYPESTWFNFYREDDYSTTVFLYSVYPGNDLPKIAEIKTRTEGFILTDPQN